MTDRGIQGAVWVDFLIVRVEAAALAVQAFRQSEFVENVGPAIRLEGEVRPATTRHVVTVGQVLRWADGAATSRAEA